MLDLRASWSVCEPFESRLSVSYSFILPLDFIPVDFQNEEFLGASFSRAGLKDQGA